jgi:hypothetical protein
MSRFWEKGEMPPKDTLCEVEENLRLFENIERLLKKAMEEIMEVNQTIEGNRMAVGEKGESMHSVFDIAPRISFWYILMVEEGLK